jgi:hypothetical protein
MIEVFFPKQLLWWETYFELKLFRMDKWTLVSSMLLPLETKQNVSQFLWLSFLWTKPESCWLTNLTWPCVLHNLERSMMKTLKQHCNGKIWPFNYKSQRIGSHYFHHLPFFFLWWFLIVSIFIPIQFCPSLTLVDWMNYIHEICSNARTWIGQLMKIGSLLFCEEVWAQ